MSDLRWIERPDIAQPIVICAFEGWNDAGESSTEAVRVLQDLWESVPIAEIDPERFFDFTTARPHVVRHDDGVRRIEWPANEFHLARPAGSPPIILLSGVEPQLSWRTFSQCVLELCEAVDARLLLTLGSLLAEVPHTRATTVFGSTSDERVAEALGFELSRYEGPIGITGVLGERCAQAGRHAAALWAAVPSYVPAAPSPKAAKALVDRVAELLSIEPPTTFLEDEIEEYEEQISDLVAEDEETVAYVAHLEERYDHEAAADSKAEALVTEVEAFLRNL